MTQTKRPHLPDALKQLRQEFQDRCRDDVPGLLLASTYAETLLQALQQAVRARGDSRDKWALMAVGGFGRGEMSFLSDLDLLFLYHRRLPPSLEELIRELAYQLWDADFEVGYTTSSVSGAKQLMRDDFSVETTYLDPRFIGGNRRFFDDWRKSLLKSYGSQKRKRFLRNLVGYREKRLMEYGESSYLLEPQVKEGIGGLRDLHMIHWAGMVFTGSGSYSVLRERRWLEADEILWLEQAHDFLWRVRLQLHQLHGRRQDQLLLSDQEPLAARLGFINGREGSAVEAFMRYYYRHTARIRRVTTFFLERLEENELSGFRKRTQRKRILPGPFRLVGQHLQFMEPELVSQRPEVIMQFFWQVARSGAHFHHRMGQVIRSNLKHFTDEHRRDPRVIEQFFDILLDSENAFRVLKAMIETGFLERFLPEFSPIRYRVQYDVYHLYTVDEHLLRTVWQLHRMSEETDDNIPDFDLGGILTEVENKKVFFLAALVHDIGKGQGRNHAARGAIMARHLGHRMRMTPTEVDLLEYLVANHLLLAETALKRDLSEEKPVFKCALQIGDRQRLRMLYLLTVADSKATGPGAWNTWKASLLRELYTKVDHILLRGDWRAEDIEKQARKTQAKVLQQLSEQTAEQEGAVRRWLEGLSYRYLMSQPADAVVEHYHMERLLRKQRVAVTMKADEGEMWQLSLAARDQPGLFATIAGVLWIRGLNILSADIFTRTSGIALDVIVVESIPDPLHPEGLVERIQRDLEQALADKNHLPALIERDRRSSLHRRSHVPRRADRVVISEEASDFYTVIEVYTWDRPGVLYAIANTFYELGLTIQLAKISTPGAQVVDVFYLTDLEGDKLLDEQLHERVKGALLECLNKV